MNIKHIVIFLGLLSVSSVFFLSFYMVSAVSDDFVVTTSIIGDIVPPTVPTPFNAIPIATTQVNLTWGQSTDDVILSGYHVWRDDIQVATTSNLFYADTDLTASTTYLYYVTAYDSSNNESASSTAISTLTLSESSTGAKYGTLIHRFQNELQSLVVLPERDSVVIRYETRSYIKSVIKWGRGTSYELGSLLEYAYTKFHETRISGLAPDTRYKFKIEGENRFGKYGQMHTGEFITLPAEDTFPPGNVTNLIAIKSGDDIALSWSNPEDTDFIKVRIVSSVNFYPSDVADGWVIYEGDGTGTVDRGASEVGLWRYYTVFAYDRKGNVSSGSVVRVYLGDDVGDLPEEIDPELDEISLNLTDIIFSQDGEFLDIYDDWSVDIDGSKKLSISIPYEILPEHLKTILVTLEDSLDSNKIFKFLLRINKEKTSYIGTLAPFGQNGTFPIRISIFDFKTTQIGYASGILNSNISSIYLDRDTETSFALKLLRTFTQPYLLFLIFGLLILAFLSRRLMHRKR